MKVSVKHKYLPFGAVDQDGILDVLDSGNIVISIGLPQVIADDNPVSYVGGNMFEDEIMGIFEDMALGNYISPNRTAVLADYDCCDVVQRSEEPRQLAGALNGLLVDTSDNDTVFVDPSAGIVNALKFVGVSEMNVVYTREDFPANEVEKTAQYAYQEGIAYRNPAGLNADESAKVITQIESRFIIDNKKAMDIKSYSCLIGETREWLKEHQLFLGSLGHWVEHFPKSRGYEINPYHPMAYRFIDEVTQEADDRVSYFLRTGGSGSRIFDLFPNCFRYLPSQIETTFSRNRTRFKNIDVAFVAIAYEVRNAQRGVAPVMSVLGEDVRYLATDLSLVQADRGCVISDNCFVYDIPGTDLYFSRYARGRRSCLNMAPLYRTYSEAAEHGTMIWLVSSRHTDPVLLVKGMGTHYLFNMQTKPPGTYYRRQGLRYEIVSEESIINTNEGAKYGLKCMIECPGDAHQFVRRKFPCWPFRAKLELRADDYVCSERYLLLRKPNDGRVNVPVLRVLQRNYEQGSNSYVMVEGDPTGNRTWLSDPGDTGENERPVMHVYEPGPQCSSSCIWHFVDYEGNTIKRCSVKHMTGFAYALDSIYYPMDFESFKRVRFGDDIGDYYDNEVTIAPMIFEEGEEVMDLREEDDYV
jgi:hypothetical protein